MKTQLMAGRASAAWRVQPGTSKLEKIAIVLIAIVAVLQGLAISQGDSTLAGSGFSSVSPSIQYALIAVALLCSARNTKVTALLAAPIVYWLVAVIDSYGGVRLSGVLTLLSLLLFCFVKRELRAKVYSTYRWWIVAMAAAGIACYCSFSFSLPIPYQINEYYANAEKGLVYANYGISYIYGVLGSDVWRLCGLFNEPGYFGTIIAFILCVERLDFRKPSNIVLLAAGLLTFSAAFYIIIPVALVLNYVKSIRHAALVLAILAAAGAALGVLASEFVEVRIILTRIGLLEGSYTLGARTSAITDLYVANMGGDSHILFGYGGGFIGSLSTANAGIKVAYVDYGLFGTLLMCGPVIAAAFYQARGDWGALILALVFTVSLYQRFSVFSLPYYVVLFGGMACMMQPREASETSRAVIDEQHVIRQSALKGILDDR